MVADQEPIRGDLSGQRPFRQDVQRRDRRHDVRDIASLPVLEVIQGGKPEPVGIREIEHAGMVASIDQQGAHVWMT